MHTSLAFNTRPFKFFPATLYIVVTCSVVSCLHVSSHPINSIYVLDVVQMNIRSSWRFPCTCSQTRIYLSFRSALLYGASSNAEVNTESEKVRETWLPKKWQLLVCDGWSQIQFDWGIPIHACVGQSCGCDCRGVWTLEFMYWFASVGPCNHGIGHAFYGEIVSILM